MPFSLFARLVKLCRVDLESVMEFPPFPPFGDLAGMCVKKRKKKEHGFFFLFNALRAWTRQSPLVAHPPFVSRGRRCRAIFFIKKKPASLVCLVLHMLGKGSHKGEIERGYLRNETLAAG